MFKSPNQRKFMFASDKDKQQGQNPQQVHAQKSNPASIATSHPSQMTMPPPTFQAGMLGQAPRFHPPVPGQINPTSNPGMHLPKPGASNPIAVPALPGMPRFAKMRKYLK